MKKIVIYVILALIFSLLPGSASAYSKHSVISQFDAAKMILESSGRDVSSADKIEADVQGLGLLEDFQPASPITTSSFFKALFKLFDIELESGDFFDAGLAKNPEVSYAIILDLIRPRVYGGTSERLTYFKAEHAIEMFLKIKNILVKDSMYGKLDMHEHYVAGTDREKLFRAMGAFGISKMFLMPTGGAPDNRGYKENQAELLRLQKLYPDRIFAWCTVDEADSKAAQVLEKCLKKGGKGLKLLGGHPKLYDEPLDSPNMMKVYKVVEKYGVPVNIHGSVINIPTMWDELNNVYASFPTVTFVQAHYCSVNMKEMALTKCAELLDKYPNLYIDMSTGGGLKRELKFYKLDPEKIRNFVLKYQDRLMWGSDVIFSKKIGWGFAHSRIKCDLDLHKTETFYCDQAENVDEEQSGFHLSYDVLKKIYFDNPREILLGK